MSGHSGVLQKERALKKIATVEAATQDKMTVEEGAGFAKEIEDFVHRKSYFLFLLTHSMKASTPPPP